MGETIITAIITGGLALIGSIASSAVTYSKTSEAIKIAQAITDTKVEELTREVREHNGFAQKIPVLESKIENVNRRLDRLE